MRGTIAQRSEGSWTVQVSGGFNEAGKRVRITRTVRGSRRDAERERTRMLRDIDDGLTADPGRLTLASYLEERWLPHIATRVRPTTHARYCSLMRIHIIPKIGRTKLAKLRPMHVQGALDAMLAEGLNPRTAIHAHHVLGGALRQAVAWQVLAVNPVTSVSPPRAERPTLRVPDADVVRMLIDAAEGRLRVAVVLGASAGLRRGETLGMRWSAIDGNTVRVTASLQRVNGELAFLDPKTDRGRRTVVLPPFAVTELARWRKEQNERRLLLGPAWSGSGVVVDRGDGSPWDPGELSHAFAALCKREGVAGVRFHDLRHAAATQLLVAGVHPKVVSEALGHSSTAFTMDTYSHVLPSMGEQVAAAMEAALGASSGSKSGSNG